MTNKSDFKFKYNADQGQYEAQFYGTVVSLGEVNQVNSNGTKYAVGAVEFTNAEGELKTVSAICFEKNVAKGIKVGTTYLCNVSITDARPDEPIISISPLTSAVRATCSDFNFIPAEATVGAEQTV